MLRRRSNKKTNPSKNFFPFSNQVEVFKHVWNTRKHECWLSTVPLNFEVGSQQWFCCMAHVLRKGTYTYWKLNPGNIILLHPLMHDLVDNWDEKYREKYPHIDFDKWFTLQSVFREEYDIFKQENLLA